MKPLPRTPRPSAVGRWLRVLTVLLGGTAFGLGSGALAVQGILTLLTGGLTREGWGAAPAWLLLMAIGAFLCGIVGFALSIARVGCEPAVNYNVGQWLGIVVGATVGGLVIFQGFPHLYLYYQVIWLAFLVPLLAAIGGYLALLLFDLLQK